MTTQTGTAGPTVVLGAGVSGLSAAWALARAGRGVVVLEKEAHAGGLAVTKARGGYLYDLGPHNIHTRHREVLAFLRKRFPSLYRYEPRMVIQRRGAFVPYPLRGLRVLTSLAPARIPAAVLSFIAARLRMFAGDPPEDGSFRRWIENRFGSVLYREYFCDYPKKVWRLPPEEIDRHVAEARIPAIGLAEMVRAAVLGRVARVDHPEVTSENFYLPRGIGEIARYLEGDLRSRGVTVRFGVRVVAVEADAERARAVRIEADGRVETIECGHLLSTIPLSACVALFAGAPPAVRAAADALDHCASVLLFLAVRRTDPLPAHMVYFAEPDVLFSRVSDVGAFSREMVPPGRTLLCVEFPCTVGDGTWRRDDAALATHAREVLASRGLLREGDVEETFVERVPYSYPRFRKGYRERVRACLDFLHAHRNVISYGRQGGFAYINTDDCLRLGFRAALAVLHAEAVGDGCGEWFENQA